MQVILHGTFDYRWKSGESIKPFWRKSSQVTQGRILEAPVDWSRLQPIFFNYCILDLFCDKRVICCVWIFGFLLRWADFMWGQCACLKWLNSFFVWVQPQVLRIAVCWWLLLCKWGDGAILETSMLDLFEINLVWGVIIVLNLLFVNLLLLLSLIEWDLSYKWICDKLLLLFLLLDPLLSVISPLILDAL